MIFSLILYAQVAAGQPLFPDTPPRIRRDHRNDVRAIFALLLEDRLKSKGEAPDGSYLVVAASTTVFCKDESASRKENCVLSLANDSIVQSTTLPLVAADFKAALISGNQVSQQVPELGLKSAKIVPSKDIEEIFAKNGWWDEFYRRYPGSRGFVEFTTPVFSADGLEALVYLSHSCGGLCGTGWVIHLSRVQGEWRIVDRQMLWIS